jgi:hypothetical protein
MSSSRSSARSPERRLRAEDEHPVLLSHLAKYRSLMPAFALILHLIDGVDAGVGGPVRWRCPRSPVSSLRTS